MVDEVARHHGPGQGASKITRVLSQCGLESEVPPFSLITYTPNKERLIFVDYRQLVNLKRDVRVKYQNEKFCCHRVYLFDASYIYV